MKKSARWAAFILACVMLAASGCSYVAKEESVPLKHPEELEAGRPDCRECHEDVSTGTLKPYEEFRHTSTFVEKHYLYAKQGQNLCMACHDLSYCGTCHAHREELKPNVKNPERPDRFLPHRGDYITQHPLDARMNPGPCFKCHGNKADTVCLRCHR